VRRERLGLPVLLHPSIFRHREIRIGLPILSTQTFAQAGLLFLVPVFAQSVLGFDAFETGLTLLPLSIGVLVTSVASAQLGRKIYPKYLIQSGLVLLFIGGVILARSLPGASVGSDLALGLLIGGVGIGFVVGQLPNIVLSGAEQDEASEASGLQGTAQNLGMALGTAIIGTVILSVALTSIGDQVEESSGVPADTKVELAAPTQSPLEKADAEAVNDILEIYDDAVLAGFQTAIIVGGVVALLGALLAFRLPKVRIEDDGSAEATISEVVRNPTIPGVQLEMQDLGRGNRP
jgi:Na+/melibiose symporter-like transporter